MVQEAFKKQFLNSQELFQAKRWEGKPWRFRLKYLIANYPEVAFSTFGFLVIVPAIIAVRWFLHNDEKELALNKYKPYYAVVRDDHPNIANIIKEKELGRQYFPK